MTVDIGFDDHIRLTTDHDQVFDIVAANQHKATTIIDRGRICDGQTCVFAASAGGHAGPGEHTIQHIKDEDGDQCDNAAGDPIGGIHWNAKKI